jgi:hypothetical protein
LPAGIDADDLVAHGVVDVGGGAAEGVDLGDLAAQGVGSRGLCRGRADFIMRSIDAYSREFDNKSPTGG